MTKLAPHQPRPIRYLETRAIGAWQMKIYSITLGDASARPPFIEATIANAADVLPRDPFADGRHGVGFIIAHDGYRACFGLTYWWQGDNELHQRNFEAPKDDPQALVPIPFQPAGCVWELEVIDFERRAWLHDVLARADGPDYAAYRSRSLTTSV